MRTLGHRAALSLVLLGCVNTVSDSYVYGESVQRKCSSSLCELHFSAVGGQINFQNGEGFPCDSALVAERKLVVNGSDDDEPKYSAHFGFGFLNVLGGNPKVIDLMGSAFWKQSKPKWTKHVRITSSVLSHLIGPNFSTSPIEQFSFHDLKTDLLTNFWRVGFRKRHHSGVDVTVDCWRVSDIDRGDTKSHLRSAVNKNQVPNRLYFQVNPRAIGGNQCFIRYVDRLLCVVALSPSQPTEPYRRTNEKYGRDSKPESVVSQLASKVGELPVGVRFLFTGAFGFCGFLGGWLGGHYVHGNRPIKAALCIGGVAVLNIGWLAFLWIGSNA